MTELAQLRSQSENLGVRVRLWRELFSQEEEAEKPDEISALRVLLDATAAAEEQLRQLRTQRGQK